MYKNNIKVSNPSSEWLKVLFFVSHESLNLDLICCVNVVCVLRFKYSVYIVAGNKYGYTMTICHFQWLRMMQKILKVLLISVYICCIQMRLLKFSINDVNNRNLHLHQHNRMQSLNNSIQLIWHPLIAKYIEIALESQQIIKIPKQFKKRNGDKKKYLQWNFIKASNEVDMGGQIEKKYSINLRLVHSQYGVDTRVWIHML